MTIMTANGAISYLANIFGRDMCDWIKLAHKYNCEKNGWNYSPLQSRCFGYDNLAISLYHVFSNNNFDKKLIKEKNIEELASLVHEGWCINYIYWRDNKPYEKNSLYIKPFAELGDDVRNFCAITKYNDLPEDQKEKDRIIARFILENVN